MCPLLAQATVEVPVSVILSLAAGGVGTVAWWLMQQKLTSMTEATAAQGKTLASISETVARMDERLKQIERNQ